MQDCFQYPVVVFLLFEIKAENPPQIYLKNCFHIFYRTFPEYRLHVEVWMVYIKFVWDQRLVVGENGCFLLGLIMWHKQMEMGPGEE